MPPPAFQDAFPSRGLCVRQPSFVSWPDLHAVLTTQCCFVGDDDNEDDATGNFCTDSIDQVPSLLLRESSWLLWNTSHNMNAALSDICWLRRTKDFTRSHEPVARLPECSRSSQPPESRGAMHNQRRHHTCGSTILPVSTVLPSGWPASAPFLGVGLSFHQDIRI
eukprot:286842-Pleurochrysis_carterae.AAC.1